MNQLTTYVTEDQTSRSTIDVNPKHYLRNKELLEEIRLSKDQDELTRKAQNMLILLTKKVNMKFKYVNTQDREDCIQTALLTVFSKWRSFNPEKSSNAFAFYTEVIKRAHAKGYGDLYYNRVKGDMERKAVFMSLDTGNDGESMYSF